MPLALATKRARGFANSKKTLTKNLTSSNPLPQGYDPLVSPLTGCEIKQVPVLRLWGISREGQKACMSVHGVFPYFLVPWPTGKQLPTKDELCALAAAIETAVNQGVVVTAEGDVATAKTADAAASNTTTTTTASSRWRKPRQHVFDITVVDRVPFYGYHKSTKPYLRIQLYNPWQKKKIAQLLHSVCALLMANTFVLHWFK